MMDLDTIRALQEEARKEAAAVNLLPYQVDQDDLIAWKADFERGRFKGFPFPFIGTYEPPGYEKAGESLFVDTSGVGAPDEPALTGYQLLQALEPNMAYALISVGQFQAHLQPFLKVK